VEICQQACWVKKQTRKKKEKKEKRSKTIIVLFCFLKKTTFDV